MSAYMTAVESIMDSIPRSISLINELIDEGYSLDDIALNLLKLSPVIQEDKMAEDHFFDEQGRYIPPPQILVRAIFEGFPPRALPQAFLEFNLSGKKELYAHKAFLRFLDQNAEAMSDALNNQ